jgi:pyridoxine/pyridoxamine 5'-phosphate oxidase
MEEPFYDDLGAALGEAWRLLEAGAAERGSPFHTPALVTVAADGAPAARTVVLRAADPAARALRCHTDLRSAKVPQIVAEPRVALLFYDAGRKIQLRVSGVARLHSGDDTARAVWARLPDGSRRTYLVAPPGRPSPEPTSGMPSAPEEGGSSEEDTEPGFANFAVLHIDVQRIEWLYLAARGHRRAVFTWPGGTLSATWLTP